MKANEMSNEELADGLLSEIDVNEEMCREAGNRLRTLTALEARIKGMIDRPTITTKHANGGNGWHRCFINETCIFGCSSPNPILDMATNITKALGMEGDK